MLGLVLSVIPLILAGLDMYPKKKFYKTAAALIRATKERREFARTLLLVHTELRFAMIEIFEQINVVLTADQRRKLTAKDNVGASFFAVWQEVLGTNGNVIEMTFEHTIEHIRQILDDMASILREMVKYTEIPHDSGRESLRKIVKSHAEDETFSIMKNLTGRFKFAKTDTRRRELVAKMEEHIKSLEILNKGQKQISRFCAAGNSIESTKSYEEFLDKVRICSVNLYRALSEIWHCDCHKSLSAMLKLERRETSDLKKKKGLRFSLILTFEHVPDGCQGLWMFRETEICIAET